MYCMYKIFKSFMFCIIQFISTVKEASRHDKNLKEASISKAKRPVGLRALPKKRQLFQVIHRVKQLKHTGYLFIINKLLFCQVCKF